jgi:hypothetical protein
MNGLDHTDCEAGELKLTSAAVSLQHAKYRNTCLVLFDRLLLLDWQIYRALYTA